MRFVIVTCVILAATLADGLETGGLDRTFCCGSVQTRCAQACAGLDCSVQCQGYCGIFNTYCGLYTCGSLVNSCSTTTASSVTTTTTTSSDTTTTTAATTTTDAATTTTVAATTTTTGQQCTEAELYVSTQKGGDGVLLIDLYRPNRYLCCYITFNIYLCHAGHCDHSHLLIQKVSLIFVPASLDSRGHSDITLQLLPSPQYFSLIASNVESLYALFSSAYNQIF